MTGSAARASALDAEVRADDGADEERAARKRAAAVDYHRREVESAREAVERIEVKAAKFEEAYRLVRDRELPEAEAALEVAEVLLDEAERAVEVD